MPATLFWDVDTQVDFMQPEGLLYVPGAETILARLESLTRYGRERGMALMGSVDYHSSEDPEISGNPDFRETFPPHCLAGTPGQERVPATRPRDPLWIDSRPEDPGALSRRVRAHVARGGEVIFRKQRFDVFSNPNVDAVLGDLRPERIVVYGVALDICDRYAVEGFLDRGLKGIVLVEDATRAIRPEEGAALVKAWAARGVAIVTTARVIGGEVGV